MQKLLDIKQKIKVAMVTACRDSEAFTDELSREFSAEYLFTVHAAKAISELNGPPGEPYKIFIEKSTKHFVRDCLPHFRRGNPMVRGSTILRKGIPKIERNGRIDIAVYCDMPSRGYLGTPPLCAIELKGFNPQRTVVVADLKRNLELLRVSGNTGSSVLIFSLFASLHSFKKSNDEDQVSVDIKTTKERYLRWISEVGIISDVEVRVETFTVSKELVGTVRDEGEYLILDTDSRHHFVGAIVSFHRKI